MQGNDGEESEEQESKSEDDDENGSEAEGNGFIENDSSPEFEAGGDDDYVGSAASDSASDSDASLSDADSSTQESHAARAERKAVEGENDPTAWLEEKDIRQYSDELQLGTAEAETKLLLSLPYDKIYTTNDLKDEEHPDRSLALLYAAWIGEGELRTKPHIHIIKYAELQERLGEKRPLSTKRAKSKSKPKSNSQSRE